MEGCVFVCLFFPYRFQNKFDAVNVISRFPGVCAASMVAKGLIPHHQQQQLPVDVSPFSLVVRR